MQAAVFEGIERIVVKDVRPPELPEGGALIRVRACAVCGSDLRTYHHGSSLFSPPWIIGHEIAGEVVDVARGVTALRTGDRVTVAAAVPCGHCHACQRGWPTMCRNIKAHGFDYPGGLAEYMAVAPETITQGAVNRIPPHVTFDEASITEPLACVINGQELVDVGLGDTVVVIGAGPIGCLHVDVARARGATRIIHVEANSLRLEQARLFAADILIGGSGEDAVERVREATDGRGADVVIVACGAADAVAQSIRMAAPRGRISVFGGLPKSDPIVPVDANTIHYKELSVVGAFSSSPAQNTTALGLIAAGRVNAKALISETLPLAAVTDGLRRMKEGKVLKVLVKP